jgi:hypothetical protein
VDNVVMSLVLQFCWPGDVIRVGLTAKWLRALSLKLPLWLDIFSQSEDLLAQFLWQEQPIGSDQERFQRIFPRVLSYLRQMQHHHDKAQGKNTFLRLLRGVRFQLNPNPRVRIRTRLLTHARDIQLSSSLSLLGIGLHMFPQIEEWIYSWIFICLRSHLISLLWYCTTIVVVIELVCFRHGSTLLAALSALLLYWVFAVWLLSCCLTESPSDSAVVGQYQLAFAPTAVWILLELIFVISTPGMKTSGVRTKYWNAFGLGLLGVGWAVTLVPIYKDSAPTASWVVVLLPTWILLAFCFVFLIFATLKGVFHSRRQRTRCWLIFLAVTSWLCLLVLKLDFPHLLEWWQVWVAWQLAWCVEICTLLPWQKYRRPCESPDLLKQLSEEETDSEILVSSEYETWLSSQISLLSTQVSSSVDRVIQWHAEHGP